MPIPLPPWGAGSDVELYILRGGRQWICGNCQGLCPGVQCFYGKIYLAQIILMKVIKSHLCKRGPVCIHTVTKHSSVDKGETPSTLGDKN